MSLGSDGTCCCVGLELRPRGQGTHGPLGGATAIMLTGPLLLGATLQPVVVLDGCQCRE